MSIAPRETKCLSSCQARAGQSRFGHLVNTPSAGLTVGVLQKGHLAGGLRAARDGACRSTTWGAGESTCGITSPARSTITSSPARMSLRAKVLLVVKRRELDRHTAHGDRLEGPRRGAGRRTCRRSTSPSRVSSPRWWAGTSMRSPSEGRARPSPGAAAASRSSTFTTTPSISKSSSPRRLLPLKALLDHLLLACPAAGCRGLTLNRRSRSQASAS